MAKRAGRTAITSAWLEDVRWVDGWDVIQGAAEPSYPGIWVADPSATRLLLTNRYASLLSDEENTRADRFYQRAHAVRFKTAHILLRLLLAQLTATDPAVIRFEKGYHQKPTLASPRASAEFNLSYTENRLMIGLDRQPLGVDIEWLSRPLDIDDMVKACFSDKEAAFITARGEGMLRRFFTLWTRKEAILKLTGEGIGAHLTAFEVLDGTCHTDKACIGIGPPDHIYLYSFAIGTDFIGCVATPAPVEPFSFYQL